MLALGVAVHAQTNRWVTPYKEGLKQFQAKKYKEAIPLLEAAVKANAKAEANKLEEGVHRSDYFPYHYLYIAYVEVGDYAKAQEILDKAKNPTPKDQGLVKQFGDSQVKWAAANAPKPTGPTVNAAFVNALRDGDAALQAKRWQDAMGQYDLANKADPAAYSQQNIGSKRNQAAQALTSAQDLNSQGRGLMAASLSQAKLKFQQADQVAPGLKETTDNLAEVTRREDLYRQAKAGAEQDITAKNPKAALDKFDQAKAANPEQFTQDNLVARVNVCHSDEHSRGAAEAKRSDRPAERRRQGREGRGECPRCDEGVAEDRAPRAGERRRAEVDLHPRADPASSRPAPRTRPRCTPISASRTRPARSRPLNPTSSRA